MLCCVADPEFGIRAFLTMDAGSGLGFSGSQIPDPEPIFFYSLMKNFREKVL